MRVHASDRMGPFVEVFYEGIPVAGVTVADTDEGWIESVCCDDNGRPIVDANGHVFKTSRMYGKITLDMSRWEAKQRGENAD